MSVKKITCIIDNAVKPGSPYWGEHGLAFQIETAAGTVQFDTGASEALLAHNLAKLGQHPSSIGAIVLSHAHFDHTGGLPAILPEQGKKLPLHANPDIFRPRFSRRPDGEYKFIGLTLSEVSETLGIPPGTVGSRLHYATRSLRAALESEARTATAWERTS